MYAVRELADGRTMSVQTLFFGRGRVVIDGYGGNHGDTW